MSADELAAVPPNRLGSLAFVPHPATRIVRSRYLAFAIFAANRVGRPVTPFRSSAAADTLITRREIDVAVRQLPPGVAAFLSRLIKGKHCRRLPLCLGGAILEFRNLEVARHPAIERHRDRTLH